MKRKTTLAIYLFGAIAILACRQIVGISDEPSTREQPDGAVDAGLEAAPAICGLTSLGSTCQQCIDTQCCTESRDCKNSAACNALEGCMVPCEGDAGCRSECAIKSGVASDPEIPVFQACAATHCTNECGLGCGGSATFVPVAAANDCADCIAGSACPQLTTCNEDPACLAIASCKTACVTEDCSAACNEASDASVSEITSLLNVAIGNCSTRCAIGNDWSCVGHVSWPVAQATSLTISLGVSHFPLGASPVSNVDVKLCEVSGGGLSCSQLDEGTTNSTGAVVLHQQPIDPNTVSNLVYFDLSSSSAGFHDSPASPLMPELLYPGFPFSETNASLQSAVGVASASEFAQLVTEVTGSPPNQTLGHLVLIGYDCTSSTTSGMSFAISGDDAGSSQQFYSLTGTFSTTAAATDGSGLGGFLNVPPGNVTITATPAALGRASGQESVYVRAGTVTVVHMHPTLTQ